MIMEYIYLFSQLLELQQLVALIIQSLLSLFEELNIFLPRYLLAERDDYIHSTNLNLHLFDINLYGFFNNGD